ncbi:MAG: serine/threonine protein kinase [Victivallales bacterium]|nr:serine/threonine protein kinase [Victivallales bacterium]
MSEETQQIIGEDSEAGKSAQPLLSDESDYREQGKTQVILKDKEGHLIPGKPLGEDRRYLHLPGYEFLSLLGKGGMGKVYLARQLSLDRYVAIKMLRSEVATPMSNLEGEAQTLAMLNHPNVMGCYDIIRTDDGLFLVMEYIPGRMTGRMLVERFGELSEKIMVRILLDVVSGMTYISQKGFLHRDMKPDNLMIYREQFYELHNAEALFEDPGTRVVICDFGIAVAANGKDVSGKVIGSPMYMSPEQACAVENLDFRSDIYSIGCVAYYMLTGQVPFDLKTREEVLDYKMTHDLPDPREYNPKISHELARIVMKMGRVMPDDRYQSYDELRDDLERLSTEESRWFSITRHKTKARSMWKGIAFGVLMAVLCQIGYEVYVDILKPLFAPTEVSLAKTLGYWRHSDAQPWRIIADDPDEKSVFMRGSSGTGPIVLMQPFTPGTEVCFKARFFGVGKVCFGFMNEHDEQVLMRLDWYRNRDGGAMPFRISYGEDKMPAGNVKQTTQLEWLTISLSMEEDNVVFKADGKVLAVAYLVLPEGNCNFFMDSSQCHVLEVKDIYRRTK